MSMNVVALLLDVLGLVLVAVGCWMLAPWLGVVVGGVGLVVLSWAVEPRRRVRPS